MSILAGVSIETKVINRIAYVVSDLISFVMMRVGTETRQKDVQSGVLVIRKYRE